jgi:tetratricopeptide (TPR) repeat protein/predicted Ser/Thr protein kinase
VAEEELGSADTGLPPSPSDDEAHDDTVPARPATGLPDLDAALRSPEIARARSAARAKLFGGPSEPAKIDRFVVVERLGGGGMGVVYAAYDPQLDRKVALKLLRPDSAGGDLRHRLMREAQAMAKVSHPNVITVHEVGTVPGTEGEDDQVFVAMEFIEGQTLGQWMREQRRAWPDIRRMFLAIGRGLEAAHEAGLVHRDFKPDNVMIDESERPRVLDFGLARVGPSQAPPGSAEMESADGSLTLTRTGTVMGTPAYMAPEQHQSASVDERADQFSFCASLFEAAYGRRPFSGKTYRELADAVVSGKVEQPDDRGDVPSRAYEALLRGLRPDPQQRFPHMKPLLTEIAHDPWHARRRWLLAGGVVALVAGTTVAADELDNEDPACDSAAEALAGAWSRRVRRDAEAAFLATGKPYAAEAWAATEQSLTDFEQSWTRVHDSVCESGSTGLPETERLGRIACLEWRAQELDALTVLLREADGDVVERASEIAAGITDPTECATAAAQRATARLPDDPQLRAAVLEARAELAHAQSLSDAGKYRAANDVIETIRTSELVRLHPGLGAEANLRHGQLRRTTGDLAGAEASLQNAVYDALAGERDDLAFAAALELLWVLGTDRVDFERARPWIRLCESLRPRQGASSSELSELELAVGSAFAAAGRHTDARNNFEIAVEVRRADGPPEHLLEALGYLAESTFGAGGFDEALALMDEAMALAEQTSDESYVATANRRARLEWKLGRYAEARKLSQRALERTSERRGAEHPSIAIPLTGLAQAAYGLGESDEAFELTERVLELSKAGRIDDYALVEALEIRARILAERKDAMRAKREIDRALAVGRRHGAQHPMQAFIFVVQAELQRRTDRPEEALAQLEKARELLGPGYGPGDPRRQELATEVGLSLIDSGQTQRGRDVLQRAHADLMACCRQHYRLRQIERALARVDADGTLRP